MEDVIRQLDEDQDSVVNNIPRMSYYRYGGAFAAGLRHAGRPLLCTG
mgnify:CR=1 FL=1